MINKVSNTSNIQDEMKQFKDKVKRVSDIRQKVKTLLEKYPEARKNDHVLYVKYYEDILCKPFTAQNFMLGIPNFEGVSRARRKVQELYPHLKDDKATQKRAEEKEVYEEVYGNHRIDILT